MLKKSIASLVALFTMLAFLPVSASATVSGDVKLIGEAGEIQYIPTCAWSYPEGVYSNTALYTYLGRIPVNQPASKYPGTWECTNVVLHMVRLNTITMWSPFSSNYGKTPDYFKVRSRGTDPANAGAGFHTDQYYDIRSVELLNHFYGDMRVNYQSTSYTSFKLEKFVNGLPVTVSNSSIGYSLNSTIKCPTGNNDRVNCRWIHTFYTTNLETATYRITFTDTNTSGPSNSQAGSYQVFFYLTR